jgi:hypothetical protein
MPTQHMVIPMAVKERYLRDVASETEYTFDELSETAESLERAIQNNLHKHFRRCRLESGYDYWILEEDSSYMGLWLALNESELVSEMRGVDWCSDNARLLAVGSAHLHQFRDRGLTVEIPGGAARAYKTPFFYPIRVMYPDGWEDGRYHTHQRFEELVARYDLSPSEALDYWVAGRGNLETYDWAAKRGVQPEAVRKNIRQARDKLSDEDRGATHEKAKLTAVLHEDVDEFYDEERDVYYQSMAGDDDLEESNGITK